MSYYINITLELYREVVIKSSGRIKDCIWHRFYFSTRQNDSLFGLCISSIKSTQSTMCAGFCLL